MLILMTSCFQSCQQEEKPTIANDQEEEAVLETISTTDIESDDIDEITNLAEADVMDGMSGGKKIHLLCAIVTRDEENKTITIDFGDGCKGPRGRTRRGKIIIAYSSEIGDNMANRIITFENFYVNNKGITGMIELRDVSINANGNFVCTKRITDLKITFRNSESITFNGSRTREWIAGAGDDDPQNNVFKITGSLSGVSTKGRSFTHEIVEPVIVDWSCVAEGNLARVSGRIRLTKLFGFGDRTRIIDYGDGACDNEVTIITIKRTYKIKVVG